MPDDDQLIQSLLSFDVATEKTVKTTAFHPRFHDLYKDNWKKSADRQEERRILWLQRQQK